MQAIHSYPAMTRLHLQKIGGRMQLLLLAHVPPSTQQDIPSLAYIDRE